MKKSLSAILIVFGLLTSCSKEEETITKENVPTTNKVLMLKVDYLTSTFEGGKETTYPTNSSTFTISKQYDPPVDFGNIKLTYKELNETLFDGTIIWMGSGGMNYPQNLILANQFNSVASTDTKNPSAGFQNVFNPNNQNYDYTPIWLSVQKLQKVREYLQSNPKESVKIFLYTPSVGVGNPAEWDWILFMKN